MRARSCMCVVYMDLIATIVWCNRSQNLFVCVIAEGTCRVSYSAAIHIALVYVFSMLEFNGGEKPCHKSQHMALSLPLRRV